MAPQLIFPEEELAVTTPRQLAPTVGPVMKGVEIVGAARRAMEKLAIGRVYTDEHRSEERRVGKECTSWCRSRWSPYH